MNVFKTIRLGLWSILLVLCVIIGGLYLAVSQTFLSPTSLATIVNQSHLADTVRSTILLPKILASTRNSNYSPLLDDKTVTDAFNTAVTTDTLNKKLTPAVNSLQAWLDSQQPTVSFSIDMSDLSNTFADQLSQSVNAKISLLPLCTLRSTMDDAENGVCRSPYITQAALAQKINDAIKNDPALKDNMTITPDAIKLSSSVKQPGQDLPEYLNMFYAVSIVAAGIAGLVTLWLLFKHRLAGIITVGIAGLLAGILLYITAIIGVQAVGTLSTDELVQQVARTGSNIFAAALQKEALILMIGGAVMALVTSAIVIIISRRRRPERSAHLSLRGE
jgi:hypothetical protein